MTFGLHHSSWLESPDPAEAYEAVKAKAQWAEEHGCVWFSVMDHMIQIPRVGTPDEPVLEGWTVLAGLAAATSRIRLATLCAAVGYRNRLADAGNLVGGDIAEVRNKLAVLRGQDGPFGDAAASADVDVDGSSVGLSLRRE